MHVHATFEALVIQTRSLTVEETEEINTEEQVKELEDFASRYRPFKTRAGREDLEIVIRPSFRYTFAGERLLHSLRAEVSKDTESSELTSELYESLRMPALLVLGRALVHLRNLLQEPEIDVRVATLRIVEYQGETYFDYVGQRKKDAPPWEQANALIATEQFVPDLWQRLGELVASREDIPLRRQWLWDARAFATVRNLNMAITAAAISSEISAYEILESKLIQSGKVSKTRSATFVHEVSNRELLPTLLAYFDVAPPEVIKSLTLMFSQRNAIVHGKQFKQVAYQDAIGAIEAAQFLDTYLLSS